MFRRLENASFMGAGFALCLLTNATDPVTTLITAVAIGSLLLASGGFHYLDWRRRSVWAYPVLDASDVDNSTARELIEEAYDDYVEGLPTMHSNGDYDPEATAEKRGLKLHRNLLLRSLLQNLNISSHQAPTRLQR
jgi:hypothetical protein